MHRTIAHHCLGLSALFGATLACSAPPARAADAAPVPLSVTDKACEPNALSVPAGMSVFKVKNASRRAMEWEILKGVEVVEERENIVPGFVITVTATLQPGSYQMTCGLLSNAKGTLTVTAPEVAAAPPPPSPMDLVGPLAEYKVYVTQEVAAMVAATQEFVDAVKAGQLDQAQRLYAPAHLHYERIEPIAELFNDLDTSMDSRADDFEKKEADPTWVGFHRLEKGLFADKTTTGLAPAADKLLADAKDLQARLAQLAISPKAMVGGAADLLEEVASKKISGEEDRYSRTDLYDFQANLDGAQKIVALLHPLVQPRDPALSDRIDGNFAKVDAVLARYRAGDGFQSYEALSDRDRTALKGPVALLAEDLSRLRGTLGVD